MTRGRRSAAGCNRLHPLLSPFTQSDCMLPSAHLSSPGLIMSPINTLPIKTLLSWSSGKDSALTLLRLQADPRYRVIGLYTTHVADAVPFQHTPLEVVRAQAELLGLPLVTIALPEIFPPNPVYQQRVVDGLRQSGLPVEAVAFGDMFCNGIADYRRSYIEPAGWQALFPLLGEAPTRLAAEILERGIQTRLITIDTSQLDGQFCGHWYDRQLLARLPAACDPCGENGEFHTLVTQMPGFRHPLALDWQQVDRSGRFHFLRYQLSNQASLKIRDENKNTI